MSITESLTEALAGTDLVVKYPTAVAFAKRLATDLDLHQQGEAKDVATLGRLYLATITQLGLIPAKSDLKGGVNGDAPVNPLIAQRDAARARRATHVGQASS